MTQRQQQSQAKKEHIYRIAMQMFKHRGYSETTIRDICSAAGISHSTFYHFFGDKSGILAEFFDEIMGQRDINMSLTPEHLSHPFQAIFNYLMSVAELQDQMGRDFVRETMFANPKVYAARQLTISRQSGLYTIDHFLRAAQYAGFVSPELDTYGTAEYLLAGASGVFFGWTTLNDRESATQLMGRLLPRFFAAVTDEPIAV